MKKISFNNFRRFKEFAPIGLGEITFLVGKNNSGKSTLVKAILLTLDYLRNQQYTTFSFAKEVLNDANIVTFDRARCKLQDEPMISFSIEIDQYKIDIDISGEDKLTYARVDKVKIIDSRMGLEFLFNYQQDNLYLKRIGKSSDKQFSASDAKAAIKKELAAAEKELSLINKTSKEGLNLINTINKLRDKYFSATSFSQEVKEEEYTVEYPLKEFNETSTEENVLDELISDFLAKNHDLRIFFIGKNKEGSLTDKENELFDNITGIDSAKNMIRNSIAGLNLLLRRKKIFYLGANPSKQSALFNLRDKENALAQVIHEFYQMKILRGEAESLFIEKWMKEFDIGNSFYINFYAGEAYQLYIVNGSIETHLADMGMGSLQLMLLLLKVATLIRKYKKQTKGINLIIEEPELNLHPAIQSKLTDFFYAINDVYGIKFIIETHSEYIIRRSQVIGLKNDLLSNQETNPNPFKVYYFHVDDGPYEMNYTHEGRFDRNFGEGFFDAATNSTKEIFKHNRR